MSPLPPEHRESVFSDLLSEAGHLEDRLMALDDVPLLHDAHWRERALVKLRALGRELKHETLEQHSWVVPGTSATITRSSPTRALTRLDLPTFGRPMMATVKLIEHPRCRTSGERRKADGSRCQPAAFTPLPAR